jgi:hypothetical protein
VAVAQLAGMSVTWHTWLERDLAHLVRDLVHLAGA